jgi:hypothetical protein
VQGWNGASWIDLATVSNNTLVKRTVTFPAYSTDRIRINITAARSAGSYVTEIEAWTATGGPGGPAPTTTTLASSLNPAQVGASVTLTATVNGTTPTGNVGFTDNGNAIAGCTAVALTGYRQQPDRGVHDLEPRRRHSPHHRQLRGRCRQRRVGERSVGAGDHRGRRRGGSNVALASAGR